jgi:peptidoglycan/xylan/chitin deacetylase (PgdA/CDA1 family)
MRRPLFIVVFLMFLLLSLSVTPAQDKPVPVQDIRFEKQICITFDDLPVVRVHDRIQRLMITDEILGTLDEFGVKAAGFVIGDNIGGDNDILEAWLAAGYILGNHTYSHPDLNEVPTALYLHNVEKCRDIMEDMLKEFGQKERYFRYPYLHYGNTYKIKTAVADYLRNHGYIISHVSIDTDDFAYNLKFEKLYEAADSIEFVRLGNEYIEHVLERLEAAEKLADEILGRPVRHVLLLHANRLNSNFLVDLLTELEIRQYRFIPLDVALADPAYSLSESYVGPKGLSFLERLAKTDPDLLPAREVPAKKTSR